MASQKQFLIPNQQSGLILNIDQKFYEGNTDFPNIINSTGSLKYFPQIVSSSPDYNPPVVGTSVKLLTQDLVLDQPSSFFVGTQIGQAGGANPKALSGLIIQNYQNIRLLNHTPISLQYSDSNYGYYLDYYNLQVGSKVINILAGLFPNRNRSLSILKNFLTTIPQNQLFYCFIQEYGDTIIPKVSDYYISSSEPNLFRYYPGNYTNIQGQNLYWNSILITNNIIDIPNIGSNEPTSLTFNLLSIENLNDPQQLAFKTNASLTNFKPVNFIN